MSTSQQERPCTETAESTVIVERKRGSNKQREGQTSEQGNRLLEKINEASAEASPQATDFKNEIFQIRSDF